MRSRTVKIVHVMVYGTSEPDRSHCQVVWGTVVGKGQTDTPRREILVMESLILGGYKEGEYGMGRKTE